MRAAPSPAMLDRGLAFGTLFLAAFLVAQTIGSLAGAALVPPLSLAEPIAVEPPPIEPTHDFLERNLFRARRSTVAPIEPACTSDRSLRLVATVIGEEGSVAWFDRGDGLQPVRAGEQIDGAEVIAVERGAVRLSREGACAEIAIAELDAPAHFDAPAQQASLIRRSGDRAMISRSDLEAALSDPMRFARDARIVPSPGKGFALHAIKPGGIAAQLGFADGDVLERINGRRLDEPNSWLSASELIRGQELAIDYTRRGERRTLTVRIE